ncbi:protein of unknown function [Candidatus Nitrospira inopinata]|uniref:Uncharacterized protein n=1 Tax=Candidatus Nitrospira inopinata TaxID=1715989 RepID=A0A0S4KMF0_9BACT|nr:protein of unknown function [Candidatus Nitrospira inopinata]
MRRGVDPHQRKTQERLVKGISARVRFFTRTVPSRSLPVSSEKHVNFKGKMCYRKRVVLAVDTNGISNLEGGYGSGKGEVRGGDRHGWDGRLVGRNGLCGTGHQTR